MSYTSSSFDDKVVQLLQNGGIGFMPSDTIYGLSCRALDQSAVEKIYQIKLRDAHKPMIVLISETSQLQQLGIAADQVKLVEPYWPSALTIICEAPDSPEFLNRGTKSLAVRMPDDNKLRELISKVGPIVSTSANYQGEEPINSVDKAKQMFSEQLDFYIDGGDLGHNQPSTIVKIEQGTIKVLRAGAVKI